MADNRHTIGSLLDTYLADLAARTASLQSFARTRGIALNWRKMLGSLAPERVEVCVVMAYRAGRVATGIARSTANMEVGVLQAALRWGAELGLCEAPSQVVRLRPLPVREADQRRRKRPLSDDEAHRLLRAARSADMRAGSRAVPQTPVWAMFLATGARRGELVSMRWSQVESSPACVVVTPSSSKSGRGRRVPIPDELVGELEDLRQRSSFRLGRVLGPDDHVLRTPRGVPWARSPNNLRRSLARLLQAAGIERRDASGRIVTPHALRHTLATSLARAGVAPRVAMRLLGHSDVRTTLEVYTHVDEEDLREAVERVHRPTLAGLAAGGGWSG